MNPDEFRRRIEQLARVQWRTPDQPAVTGRSYRFCSEHGPGATIQQLYLTPAKCPDCDIICTQNPRRQFQKRSYGWIERCQECGLCRNSNGTFGALPYQKSGTVIKRSIDSQTNPVNSAECQSLPTEHDANDSWFDPVELEDHDEDLESEP